MTKGKSVWRVRMAKDANFFKGKNPKAIKFIDLFAGMGGLRIGFENAAKKLGLSPECVFTSEIKPHACKIYEQNFTKNLSLDNHNIIGDITKVNEQEIPEFDYLLAGFPCQAFSSAGKKLGFDETRGTLFFDIARILEYCEPRGFILENVDYLERHDGGNTYKVIINTLNHLGYHVTTKVLDSLNFGIPQQRKRIFIVGHINKEISLDGHIKKVSTFSDIMEQGLETYDSKFTKKVLSLYSPEELHGKKFKDKRGGSDNIHSWDLELRGPCNEDQKIIMRRLLKQRRRKPWADIIGIKWMDGMPLTAQQIHTFCEDYSLKKLTSLLDDLVVNKYLSYEHPKQSVNGKRVPDKNLDKGYNIVTGKLSFELNKIIDPNGYAPTIVATEGDKYGVIDNGKIRRTSERECLRFFGFPDEYQSNIPIKDLYDLVGNTVVIPVVEFAGTRLLEPYSKEQLMRPQIPGDYLRVRQDMMSDLTDFLNQKIRANPAAGWHYKEFGKQVEQPIIEFLLLRGLLDPKNHTDQSANKNEIPDIIDNQFKKSIFIDIKAGNMVQYATGRTVTNPNQDLSTTFRWKEETLTRFNGEDCYFIEIKYHHLEGEDLYVVESNMDKFYKFVGKTSDGLISTRRRNVRTKSWNSPSQFSSAEEFENLLIATISNSIKKDIVNNMEYLNELDRREIIDHLSDE